MPVQAGGHVILALEDVDAEDYVEGVWTLEIDEGANVRIIEAIPEVDSGASVSDEATAFRRWEADLDDGLLGLDLGERPIWIWTGGAVDAAARSVR